MQALPSSPLLLSLPPSAAGALNSSPSPEIVVPTVSKATPLENSPETCVPAQASCDQPNGVAVAEEVPKQMEERGLEVTQDSKQGPSTDTAGASEESVSSAEAPIGSSGQHMCEEVAPTKEEQSQSFVGAEESTSQEVEKICVEVKPSEEEPERAEKNVDFKPPEDLGANGEDLKMSDALKTAAEGFQNPSLDDAQDEVLPVDVNVSVDTQNENLDKKEPVILLSKAIQSKGMTSKCEAPPTSTRHLSGWFMFRQNHVPFPPRISWPYLLNTPLYTLCSRTGILHCGEKIRNWLADATC